MQKSGWQSNNFFCPFVETQFSDHIKNIPHHLYFCISNCNRKYWPLFIRLARYMLSKYTIVKLCLSWLETFNNPFNISFEPMLGSRRFTLKTDIVIFLLYVSVAFFAQTFFGVIDFSLKFNNYNLWVKICFKSNSFDLVLYLWWDIFWNVSICFTL